MAGRRLRSVSFEFAWWILLTILSGFSDIRNAVRAKMISAGVLDNSAYVVVAGPSNTYSHYITTREEYSIQRYEGASTIYGQCR